MVEPAVSQTHEVDSSLAYLNEKVGTLDDVHVAPLQDDSSIPKTKDLDSSLAHPNKEGGTLNDSHETHEKDDSSIPKEQEGNSSSTHPDKGVDTSGDSHEAHIEDGSSIPKAQEENPSSSHPDTGADALGDSHETRVEDSSSIPKPQEENPSSTHPDKGADKLNDSHENHIEDGSSIAKPQKEDPPSTGPDNGADKLNDSHENHIEDGSSIAKPPKEDPPSTGPDNGADKLNDSHESHGEDGSSIPTRQEVDPSSNHPDEEVDTLGDSHVAHVEDETNGVSNTGNPERGFVDYEIYRVNDVIVGGDRKEIYNRDSGARLHENLIQRQYIRYQGFDWELRFSWVNETSSPNTYTRTVQEGLVIREGQETERNFEVSGAFKGLSVSAGGSTKTFSERETSRTVEVRKEVPVEPHAITYFYQKRYNFLNQVWFWQKVPAWQNHNHFGVGLNGGGGRVLRTAITSIYSEEYATLLRRLTGTTNISAQAVPRLSDDPPVNRQFQNITQRAKDTLAQWGIRG